MESAEAGRLCFVDGAPERAGRCRPTHGGPFRKPSRTRLALLESGGVDGVSSLDQTRRARRGAYERISGSVNSRPSLGKSEDLAVSLFKVGTEYGERGALDPARNYGGHSHRDARGFAQPGRSVCRADLSNRPLETIPMTVGCWEGRRQPEAQRRHRIRPQGRLLSSPAPTTAARSGALILHGLLFAAKGGRIDAFAAALPSRIGLGDLGLRGARNDSGAQRRAGGRSTSSICSTASERTIAYYWYQSRSRIVANEYLGKFCLVWDTVIRGNTEGSIVRVIVPRRRDGRR